MSAPKNTGFTIIEVVLFLAISGLLFAGLMVGFGTAIDRQRYNDGITSLRSFIQDQYTKVFTTQNNRPNSISCRTTGTVSITVGNQTRGTSECLIVGRYISTDEDATELTASNIIAAKVGSSVVANDHEDLQKNYKLLGIDNISNDTVRNNMDIESYPLAGGSHIVKESGATDSGPAPNKPFRMLLIRSPRSGMLMTFVNDSPSAGSNNLDMIAKLHLQSSDKLLCLSSGSTRNGKPLVGPMMAVRLKANATNQTAVEIPPQDSKVCGI